MIGRAVSHYQIVDKIGEGGMGVVYKARDLHLDRFAAIKVLPPGRVSDEERRRRFILEAKAASALSHPNIVTIYDIDSDAGVHFIAMEYIPGRTLAEAIGPKGLPLDSALDCAVQVSSALAAAHAAGIVHRDLKPANIIISESGVAKVLDFGLAKLVENSGDERTRTAVTRAGTVLGTAAYMSPEQAAGRAVDRGSDLFSFGAVFYEALTGARAFPGDSTPTVLAGVLRDEPKPLRRLRSEIPSTLADILERCLQKDPAKRYASTQELHHDLVACREQLRTRATGGLLLARPRVLVPILALLLALAAGLSWFWVRHSRVRWARDVALPEAARLIDAEKRAEAFALLRDAGRRIPGDAKLQELLQACATPAKLVTEPPDARVAWKRYDAPEAPWQPLAQGELLPRTYLRFQISRDGYQTQERAAFPSSPLAVSLNRTGAAPGMVYIPPGMFAIRPGTPPLKFDGYWLDRYEVTNREYKAFMDHGGYRERKYWTQQFVDSGRTLSWEEATARFRDATGRPGPAVWELGTFPEGQDQYPVTGISWYEAAAYALYAGKSLPTIYHWRRACSESDFLVATFSNYGGKGTGQAGSRPGLTSWGNYDMAGNAKEWCWTNIGEMRYLLGGAWNEPVYSFSEPDAQPPFARPANAGFRCAKYDSPVPQPLLAEFRWVERDYTKEKPAGAEVYKAYSDLYAYDRSELAPAVEAVDETSQYWRREKVTFKAAYGNERVIAVLFLPRNARPPYQTVVYFPGAGDFLQRRKSDTIQPGQLEFVVRSGRALVYPVYRGTFERGGTYKTRLSADSVAWRDLILSCYKDLGRSLDYLETRPDIDRSRIGYFGHSAGAVWGPLFLAVDGRFRAAVLEIGGLSYEKYRPEVDPLHFAPRVRTPVLMLNGRYDFAFPLHLCQEPLYRLLGTPAAGKRHVTFDSAHWVPRNDMIRETLDWLDRYLGPVDGH